MKNKELEELRRENEDLKIVLGIQEEELKIYAKEVKLDLKKKLELKRLKNILKKLKKEI